ncbi:hypothetical protein FI667_g170, partial [Globisporangium splendens]
MLSSLRAALSAVALLSLACVQQQVQAHSWIDCLDTSRSKLYDQSAEYIFGGAKGNGFCDGYGAGFPGRGVQDIGTMYTHKMLKNEVEAGAQICQSVDANTYTGWRKRLKVKAGVPIYYSYLPNGHIVKDKMARGTKSGIYWTGKTDKRLQTTFDMTTENLVDGKLSDFDDGNCGETLDSNGKPGGRAGDGKPCIGSFTIPSGTPSGIYHFVWYWKFYLDDGSYADKERARGYFGASYTTCFEVEVEGSSGGSVPTTAAPPAATPTVTPAPVTSAPTAAPTAAPTTAPPTKAPTAAPATAAPNAGINFSDYTKEELTGTEKSDGDDNDDDDGDDGETEAPKEGASADTRTSVVDNESFCSRDRPSRHDAEARVRERDPLDALSLALAHEMVVAGGVVAHDHALGLLFQIHIAALDDRFERKPVMAVGEQHETAAANKFVAPADVLTRVIVPNALFADNAVCIHQASMCITAITISACVLAMVAESVHTFALQLVAHEVPDLRIAVAPKVRVAAVHEVVHPHANISWHALDVGSDRLRQTELLIGDP